MNLFSLHEAWSMKHGTCLNKIMHFANQEKKERNTSIRKRKRIIEKYRTFTHRVDFFFCICWNIGEMRDKEKSHNKTNASEQGAQGGDGGGGGGESLSSFDRCQTKWASLLSLVLLTSRQSRATSLYVISEKDKTKEAFAGGEEGGGRWQKKMERWQGAIVLVVWTRK